LPPASRLGAINIRDSLSMARDIANSTSCDHPVAPQDTLIVLAIIEPMELVYYLLLLIFCIGFYANCVIINGILLFRVWRRKTKIPVSVNYHFTRRCNKTCGFCFHTATTSHIEDLPR
jgi:hypothetical protein